MYLKKSLIWEAIHYLSTLFLHSKKSSFWLSLVSCRDQKFVCCSHVLSNKPGRFRVKEEHLIKERWSGTINMDFLLFSFVSAIHCIPRHTRSLFRKTKLLCYCRIIAQWWKCWFFFPDVHCSCELLQVLYLSEGFEKCL